MNPLLWLNQLKEAGNLSKAGSSLKISSSSFGIEARLSSNLAENLFEPCRAQQFIAKIAKNMRFFHFLDKKARSSFQKLGSIELELCPSLLRAYKKNSSLELKPRLGSSSRWRLITTSISNLNGFSFFLFLRRWQDLSHFRPDRHRRRRV